ncbi:MAG: hypothetical protein K0M67_24575 [Thiobacillus sp.]|nr:hypothetical protein [Thiobacillus sp.]
MIQSPNHKVCSRRANRPLSGWLAFKPVDFIATVPLAMVLSAVAAPPWQDERHEHADVPAFKHPSGDSACALPAFMRAMQWLEAVRRACLLIPEYGRVGMSADRCANTPATGKTA